MKTAEEYLKIWQGEEVVISEDIAIVAMKEYAKQVAEQALKGAAENVAYFEYDKIINTEIKLP